MIIKEDVSLQSISWVKSNKIELTKPTTGKVEKLYFPENRDELKELANSLFKEEGHVEIIAYSSNTYFTPSYHTKNMICTKKLNHYEINNGELICEPGVRVGEIAKYCISQGYAGFEGLVDLPGSLASAVYGNCGCFGYLINDKLKYFELLTPKGELLNYTVKELDLKFRSTTLKTGLLTGVITKVVLDVSERSNPIELKKKADDIHVERKKTQPEAANNLGTTILINTDFTTTLKGKLFNRVWRLFNAKYPSMDGVKALKITFTLFGKRKFNKYIWNIYRFMFYDEKSHSIFFEYINFIKDIYPDSHLEIEIKE